MTCSQLRMVLTVAQSKAAMPSMQVRAPQEEDMSQDSPRLAKLDGCAEGIIVARTLKLWRR